MAARSRGTPGSSGSRRGGEGEPPAPSVVHLGQRTGGCVPPRERSAIITQRAALERWRDAFPRPPSSGDDGEDNPFDRPFLVMRRGGREVPVGWHDVPEPRRSHLGETRWSCSLRCTQPTRRRSPRSATLPRGAHRARVVRAPPRAASSAAAVLTGALWWLARHRPAPPARPVLVHGDYRMGNLIVSGDRIAGVLDWEMAAPGDALADVAWCFIPLWEPAGLDERALVARYAERSGIDVDEERFPLAPGARLRAARVPPWPAPAPSTRGDRTTCAWPRCGCSCRFTSIAWRLRSPARRSYEREERLEEPMGQATTIGDLLVRSAANRPDHEAIVFPHARFTYREVADGAVQAARSLAALGVGRGDHVGLLMPNCPDFVSASSARSCSAPSSCRSTPASGAASSATSSRTPTSPSC